MHSKYHAPVIGAGLLYIAGLGLALWRTDAPPLTRLLLAVLWPLGPLAFLVTVSILLAASLIAFPVVALGAGAFGLAAWWVWG